MFHSMRQRFETLLSRVDDILADHPDEVREDADGATGKLGPPPVHPHRRPLRSRAVRRPGSVPALTAHCISPVRRPAGARRQSVVPDR